MNKRHVFVKDEIRNLIIEECAQAVMALRQSGAARFDATHSGQRGEDRSKALYDAIEVIRALAVTSQHQGAPHDRT